MPTPYRPLSDEAFFDLFASDPERAIAHIHSALHAGELAAGEKATQLLAFRQIDLIRTVVSKNVRADLVDEVADGALLKVVEAVLANPPELVNLKQFRGWVAVIAKRHVASIARDKREQLRRDAISLNYDESDEQPGKPDEPESVEVGYEIISDVDLIRSQYDCRSDDHRLIVYMRIELGFPSKQVVEILAGEYGLEYSANNVDQIARRFRDDCLGAREQ